MTARPTLRNLTGARAEPNPLSDTALIMIDCQNTYREGVMALDGVDAALAEAEALLARARNLGSPIIHIRHDAGVGSPYDISAENGQIMSSVAPVDGEPVVDKNYPSSFEKTNLDELLKDRRVTKLTLAGFMTHMCVNSTARAGFNNGYDVTVVGSATATRSLPDPRGGDIASEAVHANALAAMGDLFAHVTAKAGDVPD
ncbi:MAG: cysteine hydrolase family protein [Pseudomonadota bacterium]